MLTDIAWRCFKSTKQMFLSFEILPLLLSNSDKAQMQEHRHLLCFKATVVQKMNTNVAGQYLSVWHSRRLNALLILCDTEETLKHAGLSVVWDSRHGRCLPRDMIFIDALTKLGVTEILQLAYFLILNSCVSFCLCCRVKLNLYWLMETYSILTHRK